MLLSTKKYKLIIPIGYAALLFLGILLRKFLNKLFKLIGESLAVNEPYT